MPTKRRKIAPTRQGISPAAIEAWRIGDWHAVNRAFGIRPWQVSPFDADGPEPPPTSFGDGWTESWPRAWALRRRLIELAGPPGRVGRHGLPLGPAQKRSAFP